MALKIAQKPYKILALDGGGTFSLIQAKVLDDMYPGQSGHEVLSHFDLVAGCSGGAIVAAALFDDKSPADILELFRQRENRIQLFSPLCWHDRLIYQATRLLSHVGIIKTPFGQRFSTDAKLAFLHRVLPNFGTKELHHVGALVSEKIGHPIELMLVTYDYDRDRTCMMRSNCHSPTANFPHGPGRTTLAQAAHASSTAPVNWFHRPATFHTRRYWDGAMTGYNNPVLAGVTEAIASGIPRESIGVLSLGTSTVYPKPQEGGGFAGDLAKVANLIITDPPDAHTFIAHVMLGGELPHDPGQCPCGNTPVIRMSPVVQKVVSYRKPNFDWPPGWSESDIQRLIKMDIASTEDDDVELIESLADQWMSDIWHNQAIRAGGQLFEAMQGKHCDVPSGEAVACEIGHLRYADARQAWLAM